jgi:uncharacterized membrane protein YbaN (DUF454 family)
VELDAPRDAHLAKQTGQPERDGSLACLDIEINERAGVIRVRDPRLFGAGQRLFCNRLLAAASVQGEIRWAEVNLATATCRMEFGPDLGTSGALASAFIQTVRQAAGGSTNGARIRWWRRIGELLGRNRYARSKELLRWDALELEPATVGWEPAPGNRIVSVYRDAHITVATGLKRLEYLVLAGGSFTMTLAGLVVPGIPTVPFLLATSYYLARSSPRLDEKLRRTAFFGPILSEWEQHGALSHRSKNKLIGLSGVILVVTVILSPLAPLTLVVIVVLWFLSIYWISRLPDLAPGQGGQPWPAAMKSLAVSTG